MARATSVKDSLDHLKSGTVLWKLRDKGVRGLKLYRRKYRLNIADLIITYTPNKGLQKNSCVGNPDSKLSYGFIPSNDVIYVINDVTKTMFVSFNTLIVTFLSRKI